MSVNGFKLLAFIASGVVAGATALADEGPQSMLGAFDLRSVILSPEPLGPPSHFDISPAADESDAVPTAARSETAPPADEPAVAEADAKAKPAPKIAKTADDPPRKKAGKKPRQKPAVAARKRKSNPLDSYARDSRRQTWPCAGDGICTWVQPR